MIPVTLIHSAIIQRDLSAGKVILILSDPTVLTTVNCSFLWLSSMLVYRNVLKVQFRNATYQVSVKTIQVPKFLILIMS